jgi:hypothetical protein
MVLIAVLVAGLFQLIFPTCRLDISPWFRLYLQKMRQVMGTSAQKPILCIVFTCLPIWIVILLILALFHWILGPIAYAILLFFICWLCLDIYPAAKGQASLDAAWLATKRDALFSPMFWFAIFKAPLLVLYTTLRYTRDSWSELEGDDHQKTNLCADMVAIFSFIPARLMVIAAALVGDFSATFKASPSFWFESIRANSSQLWACMQSALRENESMPSQEAMDDEHRFNQYRAVLIVWLVVIAIFTLGYWAAA